MGPRDWALFSIFGRQHKIAVGAASGEQYASRVVVTALCRRARWPSLIFLNCLSLIERAFLLRCLGNYVLESLQEARMRVKTLGQLFIAKKYYGHQTSFPN